MLFIKMLAVVLSLLFCLVVQAGTTQGPVWKVSKNDQVLYLGGTIHLLADSDYPLPAAFDDAYQRSDILVFEIDAAQMQSDAFQQLMLEKSTYANGVTLSQVLSPSTYELLDRFLLARGGNINTLQQFKPGMLSVLLTLDELQRLGQTAQGVDAYFDQKAQTDNKGRLFLETVEQQLIFLSEMGKGQEDNLIRYTIDEISEIPQMMTALKLAWRAADESQMIAVALTPWKNDFPNMYQSLLVDRNQAWLPQIEAMLNTPEIEYVLVGALHLVGPDGLLTAFRSRGYQVENLSR